MKITKNDLPKEKPMSTYQKTPKRGYFYCYSILILSSVFTFIYGTHNPDGILMIEIDGESTVFDMFIILGVFSMIFLSLPVICGWSELKKKRKVKKKKINMGEEKQNKELAQIKKEIDNELDDGDEPYDSFNWIYGIAIVYLLIYVVSILFILFIPNLQETPNFQTFLGEYLILIIFWIIFSVLLLIIGLEFLVKWHKYRRLRYET